MADWETVSLDWTGNVATLTIDRPEAMNALNTPTLEALDEALTEAEREGARALVVTGAGENAFIAGADISHMQSLDTEEAYEYAEMGQDVMDDVEVFPAPVVAAVNGYAFGGGCELALACDIRIAAENAVIGQPEIDLGILPGWGGTQRLSQLVGDEVARRLVFLGERIPAGDAREYGLVSEVVDEGEAHGAAMELAEQFAEKPTFALQSAKEALNRVHEGDQDSGLAFERRAWAGLFGTPDQREGMEAFLEKREPEFQ
jgi:enoyl-CoA hydratase/carnithine racemase